MSGWIVPPPGFPVKSAADLRREREAKVAELGRRGLLRSDRLRDAMLGVPREDFIPRAYRDHAYEEVPLPLPGERATISCPHSYPLFYEPLGLEEGHRFLEIGVGSGYGTALAREVVGARGQVVAVDIDATTLAFARENLERAGYTDVVLVHGDGGLGDPDHAPYDRICVTAACPEVPPPLIDQLAAGGRLIAPVIDGRRQRLTLMEKTVDGIRRRVIADVLYVSLQGRYGVGHDR
jgi:protein-L-isoaspartate(D-aspartate) O-methyltransferase